MTLENRKATRYKDLAKARAEIARLFPLAMETIEGILKNKKSPRNLRFEAAKLIYYHHAGKPPTMIDVELEGEITGMGIADKLARATAEARKAFSMALDNADDMSALDGFTRKELAPVCGGVTDLPSVMPGESADSESGSPSDPEPESPSEHAGVYTCPDAPTHTGPSSREGGRGSCGRPRGSKGGLNADHE